MEKIPRKKRGKQKQSDKEDGREEEDRSIVQAEDVTSPQLTRRSARNLSVDNQENEISEPEGDNVLHYDLTQVKVINVDADQNISPYIIQRQNVGKLVRDVYGADFEIFDATADFLLYITSSYKENVNEGDAASSAAEGQQYVDHFGPITITSLFYVRAMAYSQLFQALTKRNLPQKVDGCHFNQKTLKYKARF